jgi:hypothetical protein
MIGRIQAHLEAIYGLSCEARAEAFVVEPEVARRLGSSGQVREELLIREEDGALELALYLDPALLARLRPYESATAEHLLEGELDGYCQVAEGVSHFVYLAEAAAKDRRVSLLELEAQAEVDKFAICLLHRWGEGALVWARELLHRLFEAISFHPHLSSAELWRYEEANRLARNYCSRLLPHVAERRLDKLLSALRYSYRLGAEAKLRHLALQSG